MAPSKSGRGLMITSKRNFKKSLFSGHNKSKPKPNDKKMLAANSTKYLVCLLRLPISPTISCSARALTHTSPQIN